MDWASLSDSMMDVSLFRWVRPTDDDRREMSAKEVVDVYGMPREILKDYLKVRVRDAEACRSLPLTGLLFVAYALVALMHDETATLRTVEDALRIDLVTNAKFAYHGQYHGFMGLDDVNSVADFWSWVHMGLMPVLLTQRDSWHEGSDLQTEPVDRGIWQRHNRIVGGVRFMQERSDVVPCNGRYALQDFYNLECVAGFGYELDPPTWSARVSTNPTAERWLFTYQDYANLSAAAWKMEQEKWFDKRTRKIELSIPIYNGNYGLFILVHVNLFASRGGHIWKQIIPLTSFDSLHHKVYLWFIDALWLCMLLIIFITELLEVKRVIGRYGFIGIWTNYLNVWNFLDWLGIFWSMAIIFMVITAAQWTLDVTESLESLVEAPPADTLAHGYTTAVHQFMINFEGSVNYMYKLRLAIAAYPVVIVARLFKAFDAHPRTALLATTFKFAFWDLVHIVVVYLPVFLSFALSGIVLFGKEVSSFGNSGRSIMASFRMIFSDFGWSDISRIGRVQAFTWLLTFVVVVLWLSVAMVLAVLLYHYKRAKEDAAGSSTIWGETVLMFKGWQAQRRGEHVPIVNLLHVLEMDTQRDEEEEQEERVEADDDEDGEDGEEEHGHICSIESLEALYFSHYADTDQAKIGDKQLRMLMVEALKEYYAQRKPSLGNLDTVQSMTRRVEYRSRKLMNMARAYERRIKEENEIDGLRGLVQNLVVFTDELRQEREAQRQEVVELRAIKQGLLLQMRGGEQSLSESSLPRDS